MENSKVRKVIDKESIKKLSLEEDNNVFNNIIPLIESMYESELYAQPSLIKLQREFEYYKFLASFNNNSLESKRILKK